MTPTIRNAILASVFCAAAPAWAAGVMVQVSDGAGKPLADAVLFVEPEGGAGVGRAVKSVEIEQKGLKFVPLVSVIQSGSKVAFPNYDKVKHHICGIL